MRSLYGIRKVPVSDLIPFFCCVYSAQPSFSYNPIPRSELIDEILALVYRYEYVFTVFSLPDILIQPYRHLSAFEQYNAVSLLFIIFAIATLFDSNKQPYSTEAHEYYYLARATLNISQPFRQTTLATIHTLVGRRLIIRVSYLLNHETRRSIWLITLI